MSQLNRKNLINQLLPFADIKITSNEIRILCDRFDTPRFIELEKENMCRQCPPEPDFLVSSDGIYVLCDRLRGGEKFVPFDRIYEMPQYCAFRVRSRKLFKFVHVFPETLELPSPTLRKRQHCTTRRMLASKQDENPKKPTTNDNIPILTTTLLSRFAHTIPKESPKPPMTEGQQNSQDIPILTDVLPHLFAQQEEVNNALPQTVEPDDATPILTTALPHLVSGMQQIKKEEIKEEKHDDHDDDDYDVPILTTLLPHLESHL